MTKDRNINIDTLVNSYLDLTKDINSSSEELFKDTLSLNQSARTAHTNYLSMFNELEKQYIGDIEYFYHTDIALLAIKQSNLGVTERARQVCLSSLHRYEQLLISIEDHVRFNRTIKLAWLSILIAVASVIVPVLFNYIV